MNIALSYRGFYKRQHPQKNNFTLDIFKNHLNSLNSLDIKNIDIYIHTYSINDYEDKKLLSIFKNYNLKNYIFEKKIHDKISYSIINSLKLINNGYDLIINIRFDIYFIKNLNKWLIKNDKLNLCFKNLYGRTWNKSKKVCDSIYILPTKYKKILISALKKSQNCRQNGPGHYIYKYLNINESDINFMIDGFFSSNTDICVNNHFYLKRD